MELQLALDTSALGSKGLVVAEKVKDLVDIVEIGTPYALTYPVSVFEEFRKVLPDKVKLLADWKIMDGGKVIGAMALDAGADIVTISARTWDETIREGVEMAKERGKSIMIDLMAVPTDEIAERAAQMDEMGAEYLYIHRPRFGAPVQEIVERVRPVVKKTKLGISGAVDADVIRAVKPYHVDYAVVGTAITRAEDPRKAALEILKAMEE